MKTFSVEYAKQPWRNRSFQVRGVCSMSNLPEAVYRGDKLGRGETPRNEVLVSRHATISEAMDEANRLARLDRAHSYTVGMAPCAL